MPARRGHWSADVMRPGRMASRLIPQSNSLSGVILYLALAFPPLFFGSRSPFVVAIWCMVLGAGLALCSTRHLSRGHWQVLAAIGAICVAYGIVVWLQMSPNSSLAGVDAVWEAAASALGNNLTGYAAVVPDDPYFALGPPLANVMALALGLIVGNNHDRARLGVRIVAYAGVAYALFGFISFLIDPSHIFWREKTHYIDTFTSTFGNRNTAATYFGSCAIIWLVLVLHEIERRSAASQDVSGLLKVLFSRRLLPSITMLIICMSALGMTNSRAGILLTLAMLAMTALIYHRRHLTLRRFLLGAITTTAAALFFLVVTGGGLRHRLQMQGLLDDEGRFAVYRSVIDMIQGNPFLGTGLGTFPSAFPQYRSRELSAQLFWDLGHNTYLELAAEVGLPLTFLVALAWAGALVILGKRLLRSPRVPIPVLVAFCTSILALLHSVIDFSLQISGYAIVVFALLGIGLSQSVRPQSSDKEDPRRHVGAGLQ